MKKAAFFVALALLLVTAYQGLVNGSGELADAETKLQRSVSVAVILYGVFGALGVIGLLRRRPWIVTVAIAWALAVVYAGTVASFAFHDPTLSQPGTIPAVAGAFFAIALICAFVIWTARNATRVPQSAGHDHIPTP
jgi:hypothetical protein